MGRPEVTVDGNAENGWIVGVHDGDRHATYSPTADTAEEAAELALEQHAEAFPAVEKDLPRGPAVDLSMFVTKDQLIAALEGERKSITDALKNLDAKIEKGLQTLGQIDGLLGRIEALEKMFHDKQSDNGGADSASSDNGGEGQQADQA